MRLIKIGIGNVDPTVGAFKSNVDQILAQVREMAVAGCHICAFGELSVSGYPCEDTVQWPTFVDQQDQELDRLVRTLTTEGLQDMVVIVGLTVYLDGELYNVAAVIAEGRILGFVPKENLPNYGVFYEGRTISPGRLGMNAQVRDIPIGDMIFEFAFGKLAVEVCEDIWRSDGPMVRRSYSGAEVVVNISASPFRLGAKRTRREMISTRAADNCTTVVYVNLVGAQDSLVFAGGGYVNQCGRMLMEAEEGHVGWQAQVVDLDRVRCVRMENTTWRRSRAQYLASHTAVAVQSAQHIAKPNNTKTFFICLKYKGKQSPLVTIIAARHNSGKYNCFQSLQRRLFNPKINYGISVPRLHEHKKVGRKNNQPFYGINIIIFGIEKKSNFKLIANRYFLGLYVKKYLGGKNRRSYKNIKYKNQNAK